jgi:hypothetical protein
MAQSMPTLEQALKDACSSLSIAVPEICFNDLSVDDSSSLAGVLAACVKALRRSPSPASASSSKPAPSAEKHGDTPEAVLKTGRGSQGAAAAADDRVVSINVGGRVFTTLHGTLTRFPGSRLEAMASERWGVPRDDAGRLFVDRRPDRFATVLDFLRDPAAGICTGATATDRETVAEELEWWGLLDHAYPEPLAESALLTDAQRRDVYHMLDGSPWQGEAWRLCYRSSRDGLTAEAFHQCCDAMQPSLVVVQTTLGTVFGGLYDGSWRSAEGHNLSKSRSFLFVLETLRGSCVIKCHANADPAGRPVVWQDARYGPVFGIFNDAEGLSRNGLAVIHRESDKLGFVTLGVTNCCFESPEGWQDSRLLTGSANGAFTIDEFEVFGCAAQAVDPEPPGAAAGASVSSASAASFSS